ncbi:DUF6879 family protein [Actinomadura flavalba]|uniref:DUF6879 family protein n=1 Tax=Actinomadura flavalba TaxID=1120938 RepID=UPI000365AE98|nr:DUF6879 family protein [Actinomadura flavalba]
MNVSTEKFEELFSSFQRSAFRLETLDAYSIPGEQATLQAFLAGEPQPESHRNAPWAASVREITRAGKRMFRVHIVQRPLSDYLRYELSWGYRRNQQAGEEFFILDVTNRPNPLAGVSDFWLFDDETAIVMEYTEAGEFLGAEIAENVGLYRTHRDRAVAEAEPFDAWWERYG